jgi:hypothetical protein
LGAWVNQQRFDYRKGTLKSERYDKLANLGFVFENEDAPSLEGLSPSCPELFDRKSRRFHYQSARGTPETLPLSEGQLS